MYFSVLTEKQSNIVLVCLGFVVALLVIGVLRTFKRLVELEKVVYNSTQNTKQLKKAVSSVKNDLG